MKVGPIIAGAIILCIALLSEIEARGKKPKFCTGENGKRYAKGEGYKDKEACKRYTCVKQGKKLKMKETKLPNCGSGEATSGDNVAASLQFLNSSMESMEAKFRDLQTSLESLLEKMDKHESCLADTTSSKCPAAASGKVSVPGAITALETPTVFSCTYNTPEITADTAILAGYAACVINVGTAMDKTTGIFTVTKAGKYRFTFMTLVYPQYKKKVIIYLTKDAGGTVTYLARALAQYKIEQVEVQITITLDVIEEVAVGDKIYISITLSSGSMIPSLPTYGYGWEQTYFTGEFISA